MSETMTMPPASASYAEFLAQGDAARKAGNVTRAFQAYMQAAQSREIPPAEACLRLARLYARQDDVLQARAWTLRVCDAAEDFQSWQSAAQLWIKLPSPHADDPTIKRTARLAVLGSYTTTQFVPMLKLAAARYGVELTTYESHYGQYRQDIIDPTSALYAFQPDLILLVVHEGELGLPAFSDHPQAQVERELEKWTSLWQAARQRCKARIIQHNFALPPEQPFGHLGARLEGSRYAMAQMLNHRLGASAGDDVSIVDCERLSAMFGKLRWFDPRYWHLSKQAVSLEALPLLAKHTAAVIAASLGLSKKCIVLDLDNTLWGGVIGEDGLAGIKLGTAAAGEAFVAFQEYLLKLKDKGLLLAVCSKNNEADAKEPFLKHPEMRIRLDDIACFIANWDTKAKNLRQIASTLNIGIDSLVFVDDNPAERTIVRQLVPEVEVITLPEDPSGYIRALDSCLLLETAGFTEEDRQRTAQYRGRAAIAELEASASSIEEFYRSLHMSAIIKPFDQIDLPRIVQLLGKTNQFNLTTRRHGLAQLQAFMADPNCVHLSLRLRDRFADHGLVSLAIAVRQGDALDIETWLMSCRVIGRTVEAELLKHLSRHALRLGCTKLTGTYIPTAKNGMVKDIYARFGFEKVGEENGTTRWVYDLVAKGPIVNDFIRNEESGTA